MKTELSKKENELKDLEIKTIVLTKLNLLRAGLEEYGIPDEVYIGTTGYFLNKRTAFYWKRYIGYCFVTEIQIGGKWYKTSSINIANFKNIENMSSLDLKMIDIGLSKIFNTLMSVFQQK